MVPDQKFLPEKLQRKIQAMYDGLQEKARKKKSSGFYNFDVFSLEVPVREAIKFQNEHYVEFCKNVLCDAYDLDQNNLPGELSEVLEFAKNNEEDLLAKNTGWLPMVKEIAKKTALSNRSVSN